MVQLVKIRGCLVVKWHCCLGLLGSMYWWESLTNCFSFHSILRWTLDNCYIILRFGNPSISSWYQFQCNLSPWVTEILILSLMQSINPLKSYACNILWISVHLLHFFCRIHIIYWIFKRVVAPKKQIKTSLCEVTWSNLSCFFLFEGITLIQNDCYIHLFFSSHSLFLFSESLSPSISPVYIPLLIEAFINQIRLPGCLRSLFKFILSKPNPPYSLLPF